MYSSIILTLIFIVGIKQQQYAQNLFTPFGASVSNGTVSNCYSGGELIISTASSNDYSLTQGFQQPDFRERIKLFVKNGIVIDDASNNFFIEELENYPDNKLIVFNRWGDVVYEAEPYLNDWDGTYKGESLPAATYYYILYLDANRGEEIHGNAYILNK